MIMQGAVGRQAVAAISTAFYVRPGGHAGNMCRVAAAGGHTRCDRRLPVTMQVAVHGEVMVAISNANYAQPGGMLDTWAESVLRAGVKNVTVASP